MRIINCEIFIFAYFKMQTVCKKKIVNETVISEHEKFTISFHLNFLFIFFCFDDKFFSPKAGTVPMKN